jgi:hypothetical protein
VDSSFQMHWCTQIFTRKQAKSGIIKWLPIAVPIIIAIFYAFKSSIFIIPAPYFKLNSVGTKHLNPRTTWGIYSARVESRKVCNAVRQQRKSLPVLLAPGRMRKDAIASSKYVFMHIAKSGGSLFALLLPKMLDGVVPNITVSLQELKYPESKASSLYSELGQLNQVDMSEATIVSREVYANNLWGLHQDLSQRSTAYSLILLRRPDERVASMFAHDTLHNSKRTQCANNAEEFISQCCPGECTCENSCRKYVDYATTSVDGLPTIEDLDFIGIQEEMPLSICMFMYTFQAMNLFQKECVETGFKPFQQIQINSHSQQSSLSTQRQHAMAIYASKKDPKRCGPECKDVNYKDYVMWRDSVELFWARFFKLIQETGIDFDC